MKKFLCLENVYGKIIILFRQVYYIKIYLRGCWFMFMNISYGFYNFFMFVLI